MLTPFILLPGLYFVFTDVDRLNVDAEPAVAVLAIQQAGRNFVQLPELEFALSISPYCAEHGERRSLSIAIADTRATLSGETLQDGKSVDVAMRVPASQMAPFALRGFCVDAAFEGESILLRSALTAHVSLRCARPGGPSIVFAAEPLDVRVDCLRSATQAAPAGD